MVSQIDSLSAHKKLLNDSNAFLIDVRSIEEINLVGFVDDKDFKNPFVTLPWKFLPNMDLNPNFINQITNLFPKKDSELFFLCKTGGRSNQACDAVSKMGFINCFNIINGFEGDLNTSNQRGKVNGWKALNLPWRQK